MRQTWDVGASAPYTACRVVAILDALFVLFATARRSPPPHSVSTWANWSLRTTISIGTVGFPD
ncbi:hypothetical protein AKJ09_10839 [Labilithrix luteola]|uniref:Uncharacterized protein n=1 Tax=Labilithrix luteola TaxID=1391654 RepID=A0A0K1QEI4_9BACT|nr:hypothetical protein AKJ09_10839 [Labilithrix luteola]